MTFRLALGTLFVCLLGAAPSRAIVHGVIDYGRGLERWPASIRASLGNLHVSFVRIADIKDDVGVLVPESELRVMRGRTVVVDRAIADFPTDLRLIPMDGRPHPLVYVESYSGGLHCCSTYYVLDSNERRPYLHKIAYRDFRVHDIIPIGPGGEYQIVGGISTEYLFDSYGYHVEPLRIYAFRDGTIRDVSAEHQARLRKDRQDMLERFNVDAPAGGLAYADGAAVVGYLADAYALREPYQAWAVVRRSFEGDLGVFERSALEWLRDEGYR